jgi:ribosomal protein S16
MAGKRYKNASGDWIEAADWGGTKRVDNTEMVVASDGGSIHSTKRLRGGELKPVIDKTGNMDVDMGGGQLTLSAKDSGADGSTGSGETPVTMGVTPKLGLFTETYTAILPIRFGFSFNKINSTTNANNFAKIRMNAPYNILQDTTFVQQLEGGGTAYGVGSHQADPYSASNVGTFNSFETTLTAATSANSGSATTSGVVSDANCIPGWRAWFEKIYDSYHVMETQYRVTFVNPETTIGNRQRIYVDKDVYTTTSSGNIMPTDSQPLYLNSVWKNVDMTIVEERNNNDSRGWIKTIQGTWRPNEWSKNTLNAEDIKGWYATGAAPAPAWVENLTILARSDEYATNPTNLNVFVELRYVVQFKDLKQGFRYTQSSDATIALNTPGDVLQVPNTRNAWGSET